MDLLEDEFGDIIQKARTGLGYNVEQLSDKSGLPVSLIEDMESYRHRPAESETRTIAEILDLNPEKLNDIALGLWHPNVSSSDQMAEVIVVAGYIGSYRVNGYILYDIHTGEAAIFDTANNSRMVIRNLREKGLKLRYVFLTHCHSDHIGGLKEIVDATCAESWFPEGELCQGLDVMNKKRCIVKDGMEFDIGGHKIKAVITPGHTKGSACYITKDYCFSGDTLFAGSIGRPYSPEGYGVLLRKVRQEILSLSKDTIIFPGHGPATTISEETKHNPFF